MTIYRGNPSIGGLSWHLATFIFSIVLPVKVLYPHTIAFKPFTSVSYKLSDICRIIRMTEQYLDIIYSRSSCWVKKNPLYISFFKHYTIWGIIIIYMFKDFRSSVLSRWKSQLRYKPIHVHCLVVLWQYNIFPYKEDLYELGKAFGGKWFLYFPFWCMKSLQKFLHCHSCK